MMSSTLASRRSNDFPTIMRSEDLMDMVFRDAPSTLDLCSIVQFPQFKQGCYCLRDFLDTFTTNTTTHTIRCSRHFTTGFSDDDFCAILNAFGKLRNLTNLIFVDGGDSRLRFLHIREISHLLIVAKQLRKLCLGRYWLLTGNDRERATLGEALRCHPSLESFIYIGCGVKPNTAQTPGTNKIQLYQSIAPRTNPDAILRALATCPKLTTVEITNSPYCARDYSQIGLTNFFSTTSSRQLKEVSIVTKMSNWSIVIALTKRQLDPSAKRVNLNSLILTTVDPAPIDTLMYLTQAMKETTVYQLSLRTWDGPFPSVMKLNKENGSSVPTLANRWSLALADALCNNTSLRILEISDITGTQCQTTKQHFGGDNIILPPKIILSSTEASGPFDMSDFSILATALRQNGRIQLFLDVGIMDHDKDSLDCVRIESCLNAVGRGSFVQGILPSNKWVNGFLLLENMCGKDKLFLQSCIFHRLRYNPLFWCHSCM